MANTESARQRLVVGGHRGMGCTDHDFYQRRRGGVPVENTLDSIRAAYAAGADYVEIDAVMSADGTLFTLHNVVPADHFFHDAPRGLLNTLSFADISGFKTGRHSNGVITPLLDILNVISDVSKQNIMWDVNIEVKGVQGSGQPIEQNNYIKKIAETIGKSNLNSERILLSSFALHNIAALSHEVPQARYGMLFAEQKEARPIYADRQDDPACRYLPYSPAGVETVIREWQRLAAPGVRLGYFHPEFSSLTPESIALARQHGAGINSWALFEEMTPARRAAYERIAQACRAQDVPFTVITDYIDAFREPSA